MAVYCCSDLHGRYDLFQKIKDFIKPEDKVYVLGDCGDRGPDGWDIIKEVYDNPQFIYLLGNHEKMLAEAMSGDTSLCFWNGGKKTFNKWRYKDGAPMIWKKRLLNLPVEETYINEKGQKIIMCHAGYTPYEDGWAPFPDDYIWNREHFDEEWDEHYPDTIMIHGHTICLTLFHYSAIILPLDYNYLNPTIVKYCNGHKIDLDLGSAFTGKVCLLNLDTWEENYFYSEIYENYKNEISKRYRGEGIRYWM